MNLTNHQILQLAGRAAGKHFDPTRCDERGLWVVREPLNDQAGQVLWNPLRSDGDARALRRQLGLTWAREPGFIVVQKVGTELKISVSILMGIEKAKRRATTLAAAELGKRMP